MALVKSQWKHTSFAFFGTLFLDLEFQNAMSRKQVHKTLEKTKTLPRQSKCITQPEGKNSVSSVMNTPVHSIFSKIPIRKKNGTANIVLITYITSILFI